MTAPRKPQDHQSKAPVEDFESTPGWQFLKPVSEVDGFDQTELIGWLDDLGLISDDAATVHPNLREVANFGRFLRDRFAKDPEGLTEFTKGRDGYQRVITLAMNYGVYVGKLEGSGSN
ncbi:hypothetical protein [Arthrobacter russicus]|uniref:Uncharacterized protein n=1 Tax=Arthrobacter russicus TaxID=172040 RepID=A0ABU1JDS8_9MICC|nr:hypothetical protein [Arthrobacter russicus]MDR6270593.1 hypothetical protein [Arthrobacter russicus]